MYLKKLSLYNFKNHAESHFQFDKKINCFVGDNGAGKTNILDAIHYLCLTKSYFNHIDSENVYFQENYFMLIGEFEKKNAGKVALQCNVKIGGGKVIKNNEEPYKRFSDHIGKFPLIIISPTDSNLIVDNSEIRRRYIDSSISQYNKRYLQDLINYNKILKQRNILLKRFIKENNFDQTSIETYNDQLIHFGNSIHKERGKFLEKLIPIFNKYYKIISENKEDVSIKYKSQLTGNRFSNLLKENINLDRKLQRTNIGIHKDDIIFQMQEKSIKKIGSQGQQKSFLMSLKLSYFNFLKKKLDLKPLLLLDDIFDKLDEKRVLKLMNLINQGEFGQVFITDTDIERSKKILALSKIDSQIFKVQNGKIV